MLCIQYVHTSLRQNLQQAQSQYKLHLHQGRLMLPRLTGFVSFQVLNKEVPDDTSREALSADLVLFTSQFSQNQALVCFEAQLLQI